jgi:hypothetical protein
VAKGVSRRLFDCWRTDRRLVVDCWSGCGGILKTFYEPSRWAPIDDTPMVLLEEKQQNKTPQTLIIARSGVNPSKQLRVR